MDKLLIVGNIIFIPIDSLDWDNKLSTKYIKGNIGGFVSLSQFWTKDEILKTWPKAKECNKFTEVHKVW